MQGFNAPLWRLSQESVEQSWWVSQNDDGSIHSQLRSVYLLNKKFYYQVLRTTRMGGWDSMIWEEKQNPYERVSFLGHFQSRRSNIIPLPWSPITEFHWTSLSCHEGFPPLATFFQSPYKWKLTDISSPACSIEQKMLVQLPGHNSQCSSGISLLKRYHCQGRQV